MDVKSYIKEEYDKFLLEQRLERGEDSFINFLDELALANSWTVTQVREKLYKADNTMKMMLAEYFIKISKGWCIHS